MSGRGAETGEITSRFIEIGSLSTELLRLQEEVDALEVGSPEHETALERIRETKTRLFELRNADRQLGFRGNVQTLNDALSDLLKYRDTEIQTHSGEPDFRPPSVTASMVMDQAWGHVPDHTYLSNALTLVINEMKARYTFLTESLRDGILHIDEEVLHAETIIGHLERILDDSSLLPDTRVKYEQDLEVRKKHLSKLLERKENDN